MSEPRHNPERGAGTPDTSVSQEVLSLVIQNISEIVALIDSEGTIRFINPQVERVLGLRPSDLIGRNAFNVVHPEDVQRAALEFADTLQKNGERVPSVLRFQDSSGAWIPLEIIANNQLHDPDIRGILFSARDIRYRNEVEEAIHRANTDVEKRIEERTIEIARTNAALRLENQSRRHAEAQLQETVSLLNATFESTADGLLVISTEGKITSCNQKFLEMWHINPEAITSGDDEPLLFSVTDKVQNSADFLNKVRELYSQPRATSFDVVTLRDGRIFERYSQPQLIAERVVGRVWSFRDVTQGRQLENELRQSQKMEAVGRLAGGVAHDFNNILMLISGYAAQLVDHSNLSADDRGLCEQILTATKRAAAVTRQLLAFSRKHLVAPSATDLNVIVVDMERMLRRLLSDSVRLEISLSDRSLPVYVDVSQIEMVLMNLAINAQDAMPDGGVLTIGTRDIRSAPKDSEDIQNNHAVLEVKDTGRGMTPEIQAHIFEPFFTTKDVNKGTGLGLSTVYGIIQRAGGHIKVESQPGVGTSFQVYIPQTTVAPPALPAAPEQLPPARGTETILLAEDESGIRAMTRVYLEGLGYRVLEAADGLEGISISQEYRGNIDLIVSDISMPEMRGDAMVEAIRSARPMVKALYMSGFADQRASELGAAILHKPFAFPDLGRRVRSVLDSTGEEKGNKADSVAD